MSRFSEALITRVVVRGFRSLENVSVDLEPLTVLVGPNGSGKSSFLEALAFVQQALSESPATAIGTRGGLQAMLTATGNHPDTLSIEIWIRSREPGAFTGSYGLRFAMGADRYQLSITETCSMEWGADRTSYRFTVEDAQWKESVADVKPLLAADRLALPLLSGLTYFAPMHTALTSLVFYDIAPGAFYAPQSGLGTGERLASGGQNAANVLRYLQSRPELQNDYQRLLQALSAAMPSIQQVILHLLPDGKMTLRFVETFAGQTVPFPPDVMSDGTLYIFGIFLAAYQATVPTLMAFEEPEKAVHPGITAVVAEVLQEAALRTQVLLTTHSPELLDYFDDTDALRAVERLDTGGTFIAPVRESQRESVREKLFTPGELHRMEGLQPAISSRSR